MARGDEKLKTLKDIKKDNDLEVNESKIEIAQVYRDANINFEYKLRDEAIKWLKELHEKCEEHTSSSNFQNEINIGGIKFNVWAENYEHYGAISFIIGFFNIKPEELPW